MSARRKLRPLRPHELAKRDQVFAEAKSRLRRGELVLLTDRAEPGMRCSYCDCSIAPDSPHNTPGYVCDDPCPAEATCIVVVLSVPRPEPIQVCDRHSEAWFDDVRSLTQPTRVDVLRTSMDGDWAAS